MSARRHKPWSQHETPRGQVDQGKTARQAQVEKALADTALFKAAKRLSSAAGILAGLIPPKEVVVTMGGKSVHWGAYSRFSVLNHLVDEISARQYINDRVHPTSIGEWISYSFWPGRRKTRPSFDEWIATIEDELGEVMAWARANLSAIEMMRLAATWPHNDWLPIDGEIE